MAQREKVTLLNKLKYELVSSFGVFIFILFFVIMVAKYSHAASYTITLTDEQDVYLQKYTAMKNNESKMKDYRSVDLTAQDYLQKETSNLVSSYAQSYINSLREKALINLGKMSKSDQEKFLTGLGGE